MQTPSTGEQIQIGEELIEAEAGDGQLSAEWSRQLAEDLFNPKIGFPLSTYFFSPIQIFFISLDMVFTYLLSVILNFLCGPILSFLSNKLDSMSTGAGGDSTRCWMQPTQDLLTLQIGFPSICQFGFLSICNLDFSDNRPPFLIVCFCWIFHSIFQCCCTHKIRPTENFCYRFFCLRVIPLVNDLSCAFQFVILCKCIWWAFENAFAVDLYFCICFDLCFPLYSGGWVLSGSSLGLWWISTDWICHQRSQPAGAWISHKCTHSHSFQMFKNPTPKTWKSY